ncbi:MAG: twin-arginine translocase subunit TatB [Variibacter sp.]|nr:twin-arginine translocase subunit TatB [Variibacter sp.]
MFDISWGELVLIGMVALIVIGPKELPAVLRTVGQWTAKIRRMAAEFQSQFQEAMREAEFADLKKQVDSIGDSVRGLSDLDPLETAKKEIEGTVSSAGATPSGEPEPSAAIPASAIGPSGGPQPGEPQPGAPADAAADSAAAQPSAAPASPEAGAGAPEPEKPSTIGEGRAA